ncbi:MAG: hypothetical protein ORN83_11135 [Chthoniobacteraceae bacterium]|nr:hypothetical protein [Chthoniobacteraceae bacterium]
MSIRKAHFRDEVWRSDESDEFVARLAESDGGSPTIVVGARRIGVFFSPRVSNMTSDRHSVLDTYKNLGWSLVSGDMSYDAVREKKKFTHHSVGGWAERPVMRCDASGYAMLTGEISGITAIDIEDVRPEHNRKLSEL